MTARWVDGDRAAFGGKGHQSRPSAIELRARRAIEASQSQQRHPNAFD